VLQVEVKSGLQPEKTSLRRSLTNQAESLILFQNEASPRFVKSLWNIRPEGAAYILCSPNHAESLENIVGSKPALTHQYL
jgi:hypothetical protein